SYEEAKEQTHRFSGGLMKGFGDLDSAISFLPKKYRRNLYLEDDTNTMPKKKENDALQSIATVYVDGTYSSDRNISGYGYALFKGDEEVHKDFGLILDDDMLNLKSVGAELYAC